MVNELVGLNEYEGSKPGNFVTPNSESECDEIMLDLGDSGTFTQH